MLLTQINCAAALMSWAAGPVFCFDGRCSVLLLQCSVSAGLVFYVSGPVFRAADPVFWCSVLPARCSVLLIWCSVSDGLASHEAFLVHQAVCLWPRSASRKQTASQELAACVSAAVVTLKFSQIPVRVEHSISDGRIISFDIHMIALSQTLFEEEINESSIHMLMKIV